MNKKLITKTAMKLEISSSLKRLGILSLLLWLGLSTPGRLEAQALTDQQETVQFSGYLKNLGIARTDKQFKNPVYGNLMHNRLELDLYPAEGLSFTIEARNRFRYGEQVELFNEAGYDYGRFMNAQDGIVNLSHVWFNDNAYVFQSEIDRFYTTYQTGDWRFRVGRQRINWGKNRIWSPNDLFNNYSFFDFDYAKRPGVDAIRAEYYRDYSSSIEVAFNPDVTLEESIGALYYSFHQWQYDFQVIGGYFNHELVTGLGWSGYIGSASFKGEANYYKPLFTDLRNKGYVLASLSGSYTFSNSLNLHLEGIYNGNDQNLGFNQVLNSSGLQANNLSLFRYGVYGQVGYNIHPLVKANLGSIFYPKESLRLLSPSIRYSVGDNWELYALAQIFTGSTNNLFPENLQREQSAFNQMNLISVRAQWSF